MSVLILGPGGTSLRERRREGGAFLHFGWTRLKQPVGASHRPEPPVEAYHSWEVAEKVQPQPGQLGIKQSVDSFSSVFGKVVLSAPDFCGEKPLGKRGIIGSGTVNGILQCRLGGQKLYNGEKKRPFE